MSVPTNQELEDAIAVSKLDALQNPLREQSGTRVIQERSVDEILKMEGAVAADIAATQPHFGLRFTKLVPPGCG